jgi:prepilin-type N-terminal cleavage/methylation domain-containing protein
LGRSRAREGFTLIEVLVAFAIGSIVILAATSGYVFVTRGWADQQSRLETQQNLRTAEAMLARALRHAGVCLDGTSIPADARPLGGTHDEATSDAIVVRMNPRCAKGTLTVSYVANPGGGETTLTLDTVQNFLPGMSAYIMASPPIGSPYGTRFRVQAVDASTNQLTVESGAISGHYLTTDNSRVFGLEEEAYAVDRTGPVPTLTRAASTFSPTPAVRGIETLRISYVLSGSGGNCEERTGPPDDLCVVALPATPTEWTIVRDVRFTISARSVRAIRALGGYFRLTTTTQIKPRDFQF